MPIVPYPASYATRYPDDKKPCATCKEVKPFGDFSQRGCGRLRSDCSTCKNTKSRDYKARNPEKVKATTAVYYAKNRETIIAKLKVWAKDNPQRYYEIHRDWKARNPEKVKASHQKLYLLNGDAIREQQTRRWQAYYEANKHHLILRAHQKRRMYDPALDTLTGDEWHQIIRDQGGVCARCKQPFTRHFAPTRDHILPLSKGGYLTKENTAALCRKCNATKGTKHIRY